MARHIKTGIRSLKTPGPGAVAHMSLHQKTNDVKEPSKRSKRTTIDPRFTPGDRLSVLYLATDAVGARKTRQRRFGERAYMGGS